MPLTTDQLIAQSKAMLAQTAAEGTKAFAGSSYDTVKPTTPTITAASLAPQTPIPFVATPPITVPTVPVYTPQVEEQAPVEKQVSEIEKIISGLTAETSVPFQEDARLKAEEAQGIADKKAKLATFQNLQTALQAESQGIDLQLAQDIQNQQNLAQQGGANVTKGGIAPQTRALQTLANQGKLQVAIKQYQNNASMAAAQGDLTSALDFVDRAIQAEFLPKEKALAVEQANLTNLKSSIEFTEAQQKRADARQNKIDADKEKLATEKANRETIEGIILQAVQNGAPDVLIQQARKGKDVFDVASELSGWTAKETAQSIQEYNFAMKNGYNGSFSDYQNEDANRKVAIARAGVANGEFGLSQGQANLFNNIITKYNASPLIAAADRTIVLKNSIEQARKNPSDGATQLNLVYSYIQALDTYQSAVREGELGLVNSIDSKVGVLSNYVSQVQNGQIVRPEVAKEIANAAENLVNTINQGAKSKAKSFESQADTLGLGEPWKKYQSGFQSSFADKTPQQKVEEAVKSSGKTYQQLISSAPKGQIAIVRDGVAGYIPVEEYNSSTDVKM